MYHGSWKMILGVINDLKNNTYYKRSILVIYSLPLFLEISN